MARDREDTRDRDRGRGREDTRSTRSSKSTGEKTRAAISINPSTYADHGLISNVNLEILDAWWSPWFFGPKDDPTKNRVIGMCISYRNMDDESEFVDGISLGQKSLFNFAPAETPWLEDGLAGGYTAEDYRKIIDDPDAFDEENMKGPFLHPTNRSIKEGGRKTNVQFWQKCFEDLCKENDIEFDWDAHDGDIGKVLKGFQIHAARIKNNMLEGEYSKEVLVPVEIHGRAKEGSKSKSSSTRRERDTEPESARSASRARSERDTSSTSTRTRDDESSTRRGKKSSPSLDPDLAEKITDKIVAKLESAKGKTLPRKKFTSLISDDDFDQQEADVVIDVVTDDAYLDFWRDSKAWDYDEDADTASL